MSLKIAWIKRLINNDQYAISPFLAHYLKIDLHQFLACNVKESDLKDCWYQNPSLFWKDVLTHCVNTILENLIK